MRLPLWSVALVTALASVASADRIKVAVVPGTAGTVDAARVDALNQDLADALAAELEVDALGGPDVRLRLPPEGLPPDCVATPTCVADVAQRTGANQLLFVVPVDTGNGGAIQLETTWVDPLSSQRASRPAIALASIADARSRFATSAHLLMPAAPARAKRTPRSPGVLVAAAPRHFTTTAKITAGIAVAGLGLGAGFGLVARSRYNDCDARGAACPTSDRDAIRSVSLVADLGFLLAVGGAIATTVLYTRSGEQAHLVVAPTPDGVAVAALGRF